MNKPTILFTANTNSTFVQRDIGLLEVDFNVVTRLVGQPKTVFQFLKESISAVFFYFSNIRKAKFVYCWFADYHSLWPAFFSKLFNKDFFLVEGGYDTVFLRDYNYGVFTNPYRSFSAKYAMKNATMNLPVSNYLKKEIQELFNKRINITTVETGYDPNFFQPSLKKNFVLTVAHVDSQKRLEIKGVNRVVELAAIMPDVEFQLVGIDEKLVPGLNATANVKFIDFLNEDDLLKILASAKVYVQFSVREGLPNAILEAMLCECVTVGIRHSGLEEAIGDKGFLLPEWNPQKAKELVQQALIDDGMGRLGREHVMKNYTPEHRYNKLSAVINK